MAGFLLFSPITYPMEDTKMRSIKRLAIIPAAVAACGIAAGCFSYHKTVDATEPPTTVVEPAPVAVAPATTSSTTTTTTDAPAVVEQQRTTTYSTP
jgi:hypothetical protein